MVVGDRTYATLRLLATCQDLTPPVTFLTRLRLEAVLHDPPPPWHPGRKGRSRRVGARQPSLQDRLEDPATRWTALIQACSRPWDPYESLLSPAATAVATTFKGWGNTVSICEAGLIVDSDPHMIV